jgi:transposase
VEILLAWEEQIRGRVAGGQGQPPLSIVKIEELLTRQGCRVPYRTLHRFAVERCGFRVRSLTVRVADGEPGVECQIDFAQMGFILDPETGKKRRVHALIFTAVLSRHMFVWLTYSQTLTAMIAGCERAWGFFNGAFKVLIPDNLKAVVTAADAVNPRLSTGWLDYAQHVGFATDPARVRGTPQDKPRVERAVQYVRANFWAGERFTDLEDAQARVTAWCSERAGMRIHGTTARRPAEMFNRSGQVHSVPVTLGSALAPAASSPGPGVGHLGVDLSGSFQVVNEDGDSPLQAAGIQVGDTLKSIKGVTLTRPIDLNIALWGTGGQKIKVVYIDTTGVSRTATVVPAVVRASQSALTVGHA